MTIITGSAAMGCSIWTAHSAQLAFIECQTAFYAAAAKNNR
jgi:hypothetical protein